MLALEPLGWGVLIPQKESNAMKSHSTSSAIPTNAIKTEALASMSASFERFCLAAGLQTLAEMMEQDALAPAASAMNGAADARRIAGARRRGRSASTAASWKWRRLQLRGLDGRESSTDAGRGGRSKPSSSRRWNGSIGSTIVG